MATYFQEHKVFIFVYDWSALPQQAVWTDIVSQFLLSLRDAFQVRCVVLQLIVAGATASGDRPHPVVCQTAELSIGTRAIG